MSVRNNAILQWVLLAFVLAAGLLAYAPTFGFLWQNWSTKPDYSHGFLVPILAAVFLYLRRERCPSSVESPAWFGILPIVAAMMVFAFGSVIRVEPIVASSIVLWLVGVTWLLFGLPMLRWALPSIIFLVFMIPLPFRGERLLSGPLQQIATTSSCWVLQLLGQPAAAEGNIIRVGEHVMGVAEACAGLRIFMGIVALAVAYIIVVNRPWWQKTILLLATLPIAIVANCTRIVVTAMLYQYASAETAEKFFHDLAGFAMIPLAAVLFGAVLVYFDRLFYETEHVQVSAVVRQHRA